MNGDCSPIGDLSVERDCPFELAAVQERRVCSLRIDDTRSVVSRGMECFWNDEMDRMIRRYPQIFSNFYYVEPEYVSHKEFLLAASAGNALCALGKGEKGFVT